MSMVPSQLSNNKAAILEQVIIQGDLSKLKPEERVQYYKAVCESVGLNPLTKPFDYIMLNGKLTLYAKRDAADQLRKIHGISVTKLEREKIEDLYVVTAYGQDKQGRTDSAIGAVSIAGLRGDALANAIMKAETKAKRRLTLSLAGLGWLDETEVDSIPEARRPAYDPHAQASAPASVEVLDENNRVITSSGDKSSEARCTDKDFLLLYDAAAANGWSRREVNAYLRERGYTKPSDVTVSEFERIFDHFSKPKAQAETTPEQTEVTTQDQEGAE